MVPVKNELARRCVELAINLLNRINHYIEHLQIVVKGMADRLIHPKRQIEDFRLKTDDLTARLIRTMNNRIVQRREHLFWRVERLQANNPMLHIGKLKEKLEKISYNLLLYMRIYLHNKQSLLRESNARLHDLNPNSILARGYSITRTIPDAVVVRDPKSVDIGQDLEVMVAKGSLICSVKGK